MKRPQQDPSARPHRFCLIDTLPRRARRVGLIVAVLFLGAWPVAAGAAVLEWTGASDTDWYTAANWNPSTSPPAPADELHVWSTPYGRSPVANAPVTVGGGTGKLHVSNAVPAVINDELRLGYDGSGELLIDTGGSVTSGLAYLGYQNVHMGTATVTGQNSLWDTNENTLYVGWSHSGDLIIEDGGLVSSGTSYVNYDIRSSGSSAIVTGDQSKWDTNSHALYIGGHGIGTLDITDGGMVSSGEGTVGVGQNDGTGIVNVTGSQSRWDTNAYTLYVGNDGFGTLVISGGAQVSNQNGIVARFPHGTGDVTVDGAASDGTPATWTNADSLYVGGHEISAGGTGNVFVNRGGEVAVGQWLKLWTQGSVNVLGGTVRFSSPNPIGFSGGALNFYAGTVAFDCDVVVGAGASQVTHDSLFGANPVISTGKGLAITGTATFLTPVTLSGGTLSVGSLAHWSYLQFDTGTLQLTGSDLTVGSGGPLGSTVSLVSGQAIDVTQQATVAAEGLVLVSDGASFGAGTLVNYGEIELAGTDARLSGGTVTNEALLTGEGRIDAALDNAGGEVRLGSTQRIILTASANSNAGAIVVEGGQLDCLGQLDNLADGRIHASGGATLDFLGGATNAGTMNFEGSENRVYGDLNITADPGRVSIGGDSRTVFFDDVVQNGLVAIGQNATAVFYGDVTGAGQYVGEGTAEFYGTFHPGNSPAVVSFEGNALFDAAARLIMELGGTEPGTQYDAIDVADTLSLGGMLDVRLIDGFVPTAGNTFDILDWSVLDGTFDSVLLPELPGNLSWDTNDLYVSGELSVESAERVPGDADGDGRVDEADAATLAHHWGQYGDWSDGDFDDDGIVGPADAAILAANWGYGTGEETGPTVPEPSCVLMLLSLLLAAGRRSRQ